MTDQAERVEASAPARGRVDWRTGRTMVQHDESFWRDHEQRRLEQGVSVSQYCAANALALSTYRHRLNGRKRSSASATAAKPIPSQPAAFVPVSHARPEVAALVEVALEGMTLRLSGEAAERVLAGVMVRLA